MNRLYTALAIAATFTLSIAGLSGQCAACSTCGSGVTTYYAPAYSGYYTASYAPAYSSCGGPALCCRPSACSSCCTPSCNSCSSCGTSGCSSCTASYLPVVPIQNDCLTCQHTNRQLPGYARRQSIPSSLARRDQDRRNEMMSQVRSSAPQMAKAAAKTNFANSKSPQMARAIESGFAAVPPQPSPISSAKPEILKTRKTTPEVAKVVSKPATKPEIVRARVLDVELSSVASMPVVKVAKGEVVRARKTTTSSEASSSRIIQARVPAEDSTEVEPTKSASHQRAAGQKTSTNKSNRQSDILMLDTVASFQ